MHDSEPTTATIDEELVAYLDGELDPAAATRVERRLADDASYRARLAHLQRTWDLLDVMQRSEADDDFARSTVEMIAIKAIDDAQTGQVRAVRQRNLGWLAVTAAVLIAAAVGYALFARGLAQPNRELVRDLPVIERLDQYRDAESVEFLQQLHREGLFAAEVDDGL